MKESVTRSTQANRRMWAMLRDLSQQVVWHGQKLAEEDWKHVLSAGLKKQRIVPNIENNGFVVLGLSTSRMTVAEMNELMDLIEMFGAVQNVRFSAPANNEELTERADRRQVTG